MYVQNSVLNGCKRRIVFRALFILGILLSALVASSVTSHTIARAAASPPLAIDQTHLDSISQTLRQKIHVTHHPPGQTTAHTKAKAQSTHTASTALPPYNNVGTSDDSAPGSANFDGSNGGYSAQALAAAGLVPGQPFQIDGTVFTWPTAQAGSLNNYVVASQVIPVTPVANATTLAFLGASSGAPVSGNATITYTDASKQNFTLGMSGWTLEGGKDQVTYGNLPAATMSYHNAAAGKQTITTYLFYTSVNIQGGKTIQSVTLPGSGSLGQLHIFAVSTRASYNNVGSSDDGTPGSGNFDGMGASYSNQALAKDGITPGSTLTYNATSFTWPNVSAGTPNNYQARGQTIPVTPIANANTIAFLGAAANGPTSGSAVLTYTDGTTSTFTLAMSDWTLNGGTAALSSGNSIAFTTTYRNGRAGNQLGNTYLFYTETSLTAGKTLQSITLPVISQGSLHIFSIGTRSQQVPTFNNVGTSDDSSSGGGNFDGAGASYSAQGLQAAGLTAGKQISRDGIFFTWPNVPSGSPNNYLVSGQVLPVTPVANAVEIGFLGASAYANTSGIATITYADGSTQTITLAFTDWGAQTATSGNTIVASPAYFNTAGGKATSHAANVYFSEFALQTGKMVKSVTLPTTLNQGQMHIFAIGTRSYFNNIGISDDANPSVANFDTLGNSYSSQEISDPNYMNWQPCDDLNYFGMDFTWPCVNANTPDNYQAQGQTIPVTSVANADTIGFVGASSNGPSSGTAIITYTDGSTQSFTLGMSDWTLNGFTQAPSYRNHLFAALKHQNTASSQITRNVFIFYAEQKLQSGKIVQSVTLPSTVNQGQMHIFSIATGVMGNVPNDVGVSLDESTIFSSYDNESRSYSEEALKAAGVYPGQSFFFNGTQFNWTESYSVIPDNYLANGQTIPVTPVPNATTLAFVGGAAYGSATGLATITYTDGTTQSFTLGLTDWYSSAISYNNLLVANMSYHNIASGKENGATYLYYADTSLQPGKTIQSVTLPATTSPGEMHIFSIGTHGPSTYNNVGITDDGDPIGGNYDGSPVPGSWSAQALQSVGIMPGANLTYNGVNFTWPNVPTDAFDNYQANGQVIPIAPVSKANTLAFLGSATYGPSSGTATITYTDNSTQTFTLGFQDWASGTALANTEAVAVVPYVNVPTGRATGNHYLYYTETSLQAGKVVKSVTLPTAANQGAIHIFAVGTRAGVYYNNAGTSDDNAPGVAGFDNANDSYSAEALKADGIVPGQTVGFDGISFTWPNTSVGALNNYIAQGQTLPVKPVANAVKLGFLGTSTYADTSGTLTITYTDGTTQNATLGLSDWLLQSNQRTQPSFGNIIVATTTYANTPSGKQNVKAYIFGAEVDLQAGKTIQSVTLPTSPSNSFMHIFAIGTRASSPYNNAGITDDTNPVMGSYDGGAGTWSAQAFQSVGITPGAKLIYNGVNFTWSNVAPGALDNYLANGQIIPVTPVANANTLAFLGSGAYGSSSGTATITYTDGTTQTFTLGLTDWWAATPAFNNTAAAVVTYSNDHAGKSMGQRTLYYTETDLQAGKTLQSVTLPSSTSPGQLHIFAIGTRAGVYYNNVRISNDAYPSLAGTDAQGNVNSYSDQALQTVGLTSGKSVTFNGVSFTWPNAADGQYDNYQANGQTLPVTPVPNATTLAFLGFSSGAATSGTATITYTDGTTQPFTLGFTDWAAAPPSYGNAVVAEMPYWNTPNGKQTGNIYVFYADTPLQAGKAIQSVTLPTIGGQSGQAMMHIFAIGTRSGAVYYNNVGTTDDNYPMIGSFDNQGSSYSAQALQAAGLVPGQTFYSDGIAYSWPGTPPGDYNNYLANGQTVPVTPVANAVKLGFLGASTYANVSGTAIINYTDGSYQPFTLGLSDWQLGSNTISQPAYGNQFVATTAYINTPSGKLNRKGYIFSAEVDLQPGKTIQSVTLPISPSNSFMHIFSLGTRAATLYNNVGISDDAHPQSANFNGAGNSYSDQALQAAGLIHGKTVTYNGVSFKWPNVSDGQYDNYQANGQTIPVKPVANATTLAFLGAASNGSSTGTGTITYSDGSTQSFSLSLTDWATSPAAYGNGVVATLPYYNTPTGKQTGNIYVFYTDVTLQAGKTVQSVTLPPYGSNGPLHVFAIGTK